MRRRRRIVAWLAFVAAGLSWRAPPERLVLAQDVQAAANDSSGAAETTGKYQFSATRRAPGQAAGLAGLEFKAPPTFELDHLDPDRFAEAMNDNPTEIFEFVRDRVGFECYDGSLRGPRGTLMALAGNSVDRASLLHAMLKHAGQRVRFAQGTLPQELAVELVSSMWAAPAANRNSEPAGELAAAFAKIAVRDVNAVFEAFRKAGRGPAGLPPDIDVLAAQARPHVWVQWRQDGRWVDLDPSFADAAPGRALAAAERTFEKFPDELFHQVKISLSVEEYRLLAEGDAAVKPQRREVLSFRDTAANLSGAELFLLVQPENWSGPHKSLQAALSQAAKETGAVKPVLLAVGRNFEAGKVFRQRLPSTAGIGGVGTLLRGAGTRNTVAAATAATLRFELISPGGKQETVDREIFDLVGKTQRAKSAAIKSGELRERLKSPDAPDLRKNVYGMLFTTGRIHPSHLARARSPKASDDEGPDKAKSDERTAASLPALMHRAQIAFTASLDALTGRIESPGRATTVLYPDSPRVQILELSSRGDRARVALDLRRHSMRAVAIGSRPQDACAAQISQGVIAGALERAFAETIAKTAKPPHDAAVVTTSSLLEQAAAQGTPLTLLSGEDDVELPGVSEETRERLRGELAGGFIIVVPAKAVEVDEAPRLAWWRVDPRTGQTVGVIDEGLHAAATEYQLGTDEQGRTTITEGELIAGEFRPEREFYYDLDPGGDDFFNQFSMFQDKLWELMSQGATGAAANWGPW